MKTTTEPLSKFFFKTMFTLWERKLPNAIAEHFANANTIIVPQERKDAARIKQKINENMMFAPEQHMMPSKN